MLKKISFGLVYEVMGRTTMEVPEDLSLEDAIDYAREHLGEQALPENPKYVGGTEEIDTQADIYFVDD